MAHFAEGSNFDFQRYIKRALEKDFRVVVGISWWIWIFSVLFLFFNAHSKTDSTFRLCHKMLLLVGTKLQSIITKMSLDSHDKSQIVRGTFLVRPSDHFFWLGRPKLLLHLMHFILFQNSFQLAFFTWTWYKFGLKSCFHQETEDIVIRLAMGIIIQLLCAYVTLPLYALVTQMGSSMRKAVFTEFVVDGVKRWRRRARKNLTLMIRKTNWTEGRPSVDANNSLETYSVDMSPSFGTLDHASEALEITDHELENNLFRPKPESEDDHDHRQKVTSFDGFHLTNPN
ncbi:Mlo-related protein [Parasponia andersonii]|uniref:Mlo-related protein n=1 Tax=Parasponia andersonii TaxID=3476 RepID=A0A2P5BD37_PARAD|nr:Mlo-related protein [Parasponia andersonii]